MDDKLFKTLEFDKIKELLKKNAVSKKGKALIENLVPSVDVFEVKALLKETDNAVACMETQSSPIHRYNDVDSILARLRIEATLSMSELLDMALFLKAVREARRGIAESLIECLIRELKNRVSHALMLEVRDSNEPAISLYEKLGFQQVGLRKNYYHNPKEHARILRKEWEI